MHCSLKGKKKYIHKKLEKSEVEFYFPVVFSASKI